jgi:hypothetical protein
VLASLAVALVTLADPAAPELRAAALPLISYGSDIGLQLGGVAYLYTLRPTGERADWGALGLAWTTHGPRGLEVKGELLRLRSSPVDAVFQLKASLDTSAPYWGEGAALGGAGVPPGSGSPPEPYRYRAVSPWLSVILRGPLAPPLGWWGRTRYTYVAVEDPPPILLAASPPGVGGGPSTLLEAGVSIDTRDRALSPQRGIFADASVFATPPFSALAVGTFGGFNVGARAYQPLAPGMVLAARILYDLKAGDVPFFERTLYEGLGYGEGLGGTGTIRGLARDRLAGEEKVLVGMELRAYVVETRWLGRLQEWGFSAGGDAGRARDSGKTPVLGAGAFVGLRLLWDHAVLLRFEVGHAGQGGPAYYIAFDEAY